MRPARASPPSLLSAPGVAHGAATQRLHGVLRAGLFVALGSGRLFDAFRGKRTATPLMVAAMQGHIEVVKLLVAANADVNRFNYVGKTAVELAREGRHFETVELLVSHGAQRQRTWQGPIYKHR